MQVAREIGPAPRLAPVKRQVRNEIGVEAAVAAAPADDRHLAASQAAEEIKEADIDHKGLHIAAKVVDDDAWEKVKEGVYKGFSIGGRVTQRDPANRKLITGLELSEISLVDRPANHEAMIDLYKRGDVLAKEGRRNSKADLERIQRVHDASVELGASCPGAPDQPDQPDQDDSGVGDDAGDTGDDQDKAEATGDLAKLASLAGRIEGLARIVEAQGALLKKIAAQPAPPKYQSEARAVEKGQDGLAKRGEPRPKFNPLADHFIEAYRMALAAGQPSPIR